MKGKKRKGQLTMVMIHRPLDIIHSRIRKPTSLEDSLPFCGCMPGHLSFNDSFQVRAVLDSTVVIDEAGVGFQVWLSELVAEDAEEAVVGASDEDAAVGGFEALVGDHGGCFVSFLSVRIGGEGWNTMRSPPSSRILLPTNQHRTPHIGQRRHLTITQTNIQMLPLPRNPPRQQRRHNRITRIQARREIRHCNAHLNWRPLTLARQPHQPEFGFHHYIEARAVAVRACLAVACDAGVD